MGAVDHWHPVLPAAALTKAPAKVVLDGHEIAVFRTESGALGAVADTCVHRRMSLSEGRVCGEALRCPYHGWLAAPCGTVTSPGAPNLRTRTLHYDTREHLGVVWIKRAGSAATFPVFDVDGYDFVGVSTIRMPVPLELACISQRSRGVPGLPSRNGITEDERTQTARNSECNDTAAGYFASRALRSHGARLSG